VPAIDVLVSTVVRSQLVLAVSASAPRPAEEGRRRFPLPSRVSCASASPSTCTV